MDSVAISFVVYTVGIAALGLYSARRARRTESDFLLANRGLGAWVAALSASASAESGWVTLGLVGFAYNTGVGALWVVPGTVVAFLFNWFVLGPRLRQDSVKRQSLTIVDVIASRYAGSSAMLIRVLGILIVLSMLTAYVAAQLNAAGKTFNGTFDWEYSSGVWIGAGIVLLYTVIGGFRAIAWTDVVQAIFMILAVTVVPLMLIAKLGGFGEFWQGLQQVEGGENLTKVFAGNAGYALVGFLALWLGIPLGNPGQPHMLVRLMAARDDKVIRRGGIVSTAWVMVLFTGAIFLGITARVYYGQIPDPENTIARVATDAQVMPGILGGMLLAAILAAICSTADSQLLVSASAISHDYATGVFRMRPSITTRLILDRAAVLVVGGVAIAIALAEVRSVFSFVLEYGWAGLGAGLGPALIMTLLWSRTSGAGVVSGMIVGVATVFIWKQFPALSQAFYNLVPAFFASLLTIYVVSLFSRPSKPA